LTDIIRVEKVNEVYNRIICEPSVGYEIKDYFTFKVPNYQFMPAYRNKMWDGNLYLYNPLTCLLYGGLNHHLEEFCKHREYKLEYSSDFSIDNFTVSDAHSFFKSLNLTMEPRDYQIDAFVNCVKNKRKLLLSPTGSGKSFIIYLLAMYYNKKTLIIVPTTSLVQQLSSDFISYGFDDTDNIHKIFEGQSKTTKSKFVFSTWQSLYKQPKAWFKQFDVVIGDEAHLFKAKSLTSIMTNLESCKYRFGFTGTLDDSNTHKLVLEGLFGPVRKVTSTSELIDKKVLSDFMINSIILSYPDNTRKLVTKMNYQEELDFLVTLPERNKFICNLCKSLKGNTLLLFQFVEKHGKVLYSMLKNSKLDKPIYFVSGQIESTEREKIRKLVESGDECIIFEFNDIKIVCKSEDKVLLSNKSYKKAKYITENDDIDDSWIINNK
jgi:superfamily II DNA or RNA helicase